MDLHKLLCLCGWLALLCPRGDNRWDTWCFFQLNGRACVSGGATAGAWTLLLGLLRQGPQTLGRGGVCLLDDAVTRAHVHGSAPVHTCRSQCAHELNVHRWACRQQRCGHGRRDSCLWAALCWCGLHCTVLVRCVQCSAVQCSLSRRVRHPAAASTLWTDSNVV